MIKKVLVLAIFMTTLLQAGSFDKGMKYFIKGQHHKALPHFVKASNQGHKEAQFYLANMYEKGLGVQKNKKKARELFILYSSKDKNKTNIIATPIKQKKRPVAKKSSVKKKQSTSKNSEGQFSKRYKKFYNPELQGAQEVHFN